MQEQNIERLVTVGVYTMPYEADIVWSLLEAFEIMVFPADYNTIYINWLYSNALGGIKLQVNEKDAEPAREIIAFILVPSSAPLVGEGGVREDFNDSGSWPESETCPHCGNSNIAPVVLGREWAVLTWLIIGIPLVWPRTRLRCSSCGHTWQCPIIS